MADKEVRLAPWSVEPTMDDVPVWTGRGWEAKQVREFVNQQSVWESVTGYGHGYLRLDCSNDPLTNSLEIEGNVNLNSAGAQVQIEGDHALSLEDATGERSNVLAGANIDTSDTYRSVVIGHDATGNISAPGFGYSVSGSVIIGDGACEDATGISNTVIIGYDAGINADQAGNAVIIGYEAGLDIGIGRSGSEGLYNVAIGTQASRRMRLARDTVVIGQEAVGGSGYASGGYTVAIGSHACYDLTSGANDVTVGAFSGYNLTSGSENVLLGDQTGFSLTTEDGCVLIGYQAGYGLTSSDILIIENSNDISTPLVYGDFSSDFFIVNGDLGVGTGTTAPDTSLDIDGAFTFRELSADPSDPDEGSAVLWVSDGTGAGDDGDVLLKITAGGTTKTTTIADFSGL